MSKKMKSGLRFVAQVACGLLAFAVFMWTPENGKGILAYALLFSALIIIIVTLSWGKYKGYWPGDPGEGDPR
jgi:hypothetical protein